MEKIEIKVRDKIVIQYPHPDDFTICVIGNRNPEEDATLGATLSRNPGSMPERLEDMSPEQIDRIVGEYFKKYGHSSIGGIGQFPPTTVEGISMVDAMRTIDFPLFAGQEASTRYIDFSKTAYTLPGELSKNSTAHNIVKKWFRIYREVRETLFKEYRKHGFSSKSAKPKAFDGARGFLPIAAKTSVFINCNIRQIIEQSWQLQASEHSLTKNIGDHLLQVVHDICPNSVKWRSEKEFKRKRAYSAALAKEVVWNNEVLRETGDEVCFKKFDTDAFLKIADAMLQSRLTDELAGRYGTIKAQAVISFGSLRDMYRHRPYAKIWCVPGVHNHSIPSVKKPRFSQWYLNQVAENTADKARRLINEALACECDPRNHLYLLPMGIQTCFEMTGNIHKWFYLLHLRSGVRVHPEVREVIHSWTKKFAQKFSMSPDRFANMSPEADYIKRSEDER